MFCKNCGKELLDGAKFCTACGATQDAVQPNAAPPSQQQAPGPAEPQYQAQQPAPILYSKPKVWSVGLGIFAAFTAILFLITVSLFYLEWTRKQEESGAAQLRLKTESCFESDGNILSDDNAYYHLGSRI